MTIDRIEMDQDLRGVRLRVRRNRNSKSPLVFQDWSTAIVEALAQLQITDEVKALLNAKDKKIEVSAVTSTAPSKPKAKPTETASDDNAGTSE